MPERRNRSATQFARAFMLGQMYAHGRTITSERLRAIFDISPATAKRDLAKLRRLGAELPVRRVITTTAGANAVELVAEGLA